MRFVIELTYLLALWLTAYVIGMTWGSLEHPARVDPHATYYFADPHFVVDRWGGERQRARHFLLISELSREGIRPDPPVRPVPIRLRLRGKPARAVL